MSLKAKLKEYIRLSNYISNRQLYEFCFREGYKPSNGERTLRTITNETPDIQKVFENGIIKGYQWRKETLF